jgi:hypothetical protein
MGKYRVWIDYGEAAEVVAQDWLDAIRQYNTTQPPRLRTKRWYVIAPHSGQVDVYVPNGTDHYQFDGAFLVVCIGEVR